MKVLVQQPATGLFFKQSQEWVSDASLAQNFENSLRAFDFCVRHTSHAAQILLLASSPEISVVIHPTPELRLNNHSKELVGGVK